MQTTDTTTERNWAPVIQAELGLIGYTISGMPDHMGRDQAEAFLTELREQALKRKATQA